MMYQYTMSQWMLFFFWYCFIGWVWESCYVSVKKAICEKKWKWINRGFLNGPFLPIYGSAAIAILIATIPVRDSIVYIFLWGMIAATLLELVTGSTMERIFHVKYWDYSDMPLNFHGYICFFVSLFWGSLSILMVKVIHVPVERVILQWPGIFCEILSVVLVAVFVFDFSESLHEALDMRDLLKKLTESKAAIRRLERRMDAVVAFTPIPDIDELREKTGSAREKITFKLEKMRAGRVAKLQQLKESLSEIKELHDRDELLKQIEQQLKGIFARNNKQFFKAVRHLKRNPGAISKKYEEALKEIKALFEEKE